MKKLKSVFVILHYNSKAFTDTIECIESIHSCFGYRDDYRIVVIENGSGDDSAKLLMEHLESDMLTDVIISDKNLGFAKGNNLGCHHAMDHYEPDFLIVINNDTILKQKEFLDKLYTKYDEEAFDVLGPYIYDRNFHPQNPQLGLRTTLEEVETSILEANEVLNYLDSKMYRFKCVLKNVVFINDTVEKLIRKIFRKEIKHVEVQDFRDEMKNVGLHGSALVFTKQYYQRYRDIFYNKTFMFVEEDILYYRILNDGLTSIFYPELEIYHKEDRSTDVTLTSSTAQQKFKVSNIIKSLEVYKELILASKE